MNPSTDDWGAEMIQESKMDVFKRTLLCNSVSSHISNVYLRLCGILIWEEHPVPKLIVFLAWPLEMLFKMVKSIHSGRVVTKVSRQNSRNPASLSSSHFLFLSLPSPLFPFLASLSMPSSVPSWIISSFSFQFSTKDLCNFAITCIIAGGCKPSLGAIPQG